MIIAAVASLKRNAAWKDKPGNAKYFAWALNLATQRKPDHRLECPAFRMNPNGRSNAAATYYIYIPMTIEKIRRNTWRFLERNHIRA
jgi:hypothetical protein